MMQTLKTIGAALSLILSMLLRGYRYGLSPVLAPNCRFAPSCSAYAETAIRQHGPLRGCWIALRRIGRCHPWGDTGYDPVPAPAQPRTALPKTTASS